MHECVVQLLALSLFKMPSVSSFIELIGEDTDTAGPYAGGGGSGFS
jgi:hypothetical protein